jgi:hypothetical protein
MASNPRLSRTASRSRDGATARARRCPTVRVEVAPSEPEPDRWQRWIALGNLLSVLFLAVGLYLTHQANQETSTANREQQRLTEQGQITDRFSKAVEQLGQPGADKIDVRLGAIYSLERLMRDSAVDHPTVVDVLTAFIRVHAPADDDLNRVGGIAEPSAPPVDIQAALTVLGHRDANRDRSQLDLSDTNLTGANLTGANLSGANLFHAYLFHAYLGDASLTRADLARANLGRADLTGTDLREANLTRADLGRANLGGAKLGGANLTLANLGGADLARADLRGANLISADLTNANLTNANLTGADLTCARTDAETHLPAGVARPADC